MSVRTEICSFQRTTEEESSRGSKGGASSLFYRRLDQYAKQIGEPYLFGADLKLAE
jgi:hypothetical protein